MLLNCFHSHNYCTVSFNNRHRQIHSSVRSVRLVACHGKAAAKNVYKICRKMQRRRHHMTAYHLYLYSYVTKLYLVCCLYCVYIVVTFTVKWSQLHFLSNTYPLAKNSIEYCRKTVVILQYTIDILQKYYSTCYYYRKNYSFTIVHNLNILQKLQYTLETIVNTIVTVVLLYALYYRD